MTEPIRIRIQGKAPDTDAPTVEDLLDQVRDYVAVLKGVETAIGQGQSELVWRVTGASKNSPLMMELTPFPVRYGTDISMRDAAVRVAIGDGLRLLRERGERPMFFNDDALERSQRLFQRVLNGLATSCLELGGGLDPIEITARDARAGMMAAEGLRRPADEPYSELTSLECRFRSLEVDGRGPKVLRVQSRLSGEDVRVTLTGQALADIEHREVAELWESDRRLRLYGTIHYKGPGKVRAMDADAIEFVPLSSELPGPEDILDPDFTGGIATEEYLRRLRGGEIS